MVSISIFLLIFYYFGYIQATNSTDECKFEYTTSFAAWRNFEIGDLYLKSTYENIYFKVYLDDVWYLIDFNITANYNGTITHEYLNFDCLVNNFSSSIILPDNIDCSNDVFLFVTINIDLMTMGPIITNGGTLSWDEYQNATSGRSFVYKVNCNCQEEMFIQTTSLSIGENSVHLNNGNSLNFKNKLISAILQYFLFIH